MKKWTNHVFRRLLSALMALTIAVGTIEMGSIAVAAEEAVTREERLAAWYDSVRLGTMYHWSMACNLAGSEPMGKQRFDNYPYTNIADYDKALENVDVSKWVEEAHTAGAQYITFASFHSTHGYIRPWHSEVPGFPQTQRDFLSELIEEAKKYDIKIIVYMTTALNHAFDDEYGWYDGDAYVEYAKEHHRDWIQQNYGRDNLTEEEWQTSFNFERSAYGFGAFTFDEVEYLLTHYDIDGLWFDALCNPTWYAADQYPYYKFDYDNCTGYDYKGESCSLPGHNQEYTYDEAGYQKYYFYKRDIIQHVNSIDPWCVTFTNNFSPLLHADIVCQEGHSLGQNFDIMNPDRGRVREYWMPEGVGNYVDDTVSFDYPSLIRQVVQVAVGGGAVSLGTSPQREVAKFAPAVTEFHQLLQEFRGWSSQAWYDPEVSVGFDIPDNYAMGYQEGGAYVMSAKNEATDTCYLHLLARPNDGKTVVLQDLMQPIESITDLHTGQPLAYKRENGKLYITVEDWTDYEKYGDTIIKVQFGEVTLSSVTALVEEVMADTSITVDERCRMVFPQLPQGYTVSIAATSEEEYISLEGIVQQTQQDHAVTLRLRVSDASGNSMKTNEISVVVPTYTLPPKLDQSKISVAEVSSVYPYENAAGVNVLDGNKDTYWHSNVVGAEGQYIVLDLGAEYSVAQIDQLPRQNNDNGYILAYDLFTSTDGQEYTLAQSGELANDGSEKQIVLQEPVRARYIKLVCRQASKKNDHCSIAELNIWVVPDETAPPMQQQRERLQRAVEMVGRTWYQLDDEVACRVQQLLIQAHELLACEDSLFADIINTADALEEYGEQPRKEGSLRVLYDFENEHQLESFVAYSSDPNGKPGLGVLTEGADALAGEKSMRVYNDVGTSWNNGVLTAQQLPVENIGGIAFRLKAAAGTSVKPMLHVGALYEGSGNRDIRQYNLFDLDGNAVTSGFNYDSAWMKLDFTEDFDGYVLVPYTAEAIKDLDVSVTDNVHFGFHFAHTPADAPEYFVDDFGVYYGTDMAAVLQDLARQRQSWAVETVGCTTDKQEASVGEIVKVVPDTVQGVFCGWSVQGITLSEEQKNARELVFVMPAGKVQIAANFEEPQIPVEGVELDKESLELTVGESAVLLAKVRPENASNRQLLWKSSNTAVATVDAQGKITAVAAGKAVVTAVAQDGGYEANCTVTVNNVQEPDTTPAPSMAPGVGTEEGTLPPTGDAAVPAACAIALLLSGCLACFLWKKQRWR